MIEALFGYPDWLFGAIGHPVTWMGAALSWLDRRFNKDEASRRTRRTCGALSLIALLMICGLVALSVTEVAFVALPRTVAFVLLGVVGSSCLAQRSLDKHVRAVADACGHDSLPAARAAVGAIVGRDTASLDAAGVARAAIESLAENFADGVVAPTFWLGLLGLPGGVLYKAVNTADSMIGHRSPRHEAFGFAAAKLDDLVNWPAARLAAMLLVLASALVPGASMREAWRIMWRDASGHASPNAGWPEAAMAGALGIRLGGPRTYAGHTLDAVIIGDGDGRTDTAAIRLALRLYRVACGLEMTAVVAGALLIARWQ